MKEIIIGSFRYLPLGFWLSYFCGLSIAELLVSMAIAGMTAEIYNVVLEETK